MRIRVFANIVKQLLEECLGELLEKSLEDVQEESLENFLGESLEKFQGIICGEVLEDTPEEIS